MADLRETIDRSRVQKPFIGSCSRCGRQAPEVKFGTRIRTLASGRAEMWRTTCDGCLNTRKRNRSKVVGDHGMTKSRVHYLKSRYGITPEQWIEMWYAQGECCGVCRSETTDGKWWHVDHDHETGKVRGILCHGCNTGLGNFGDDIARMRRAIEYLEAHLG